MNRIFQILTILILGLTACAPTSVAYESPDSPSSPVMEVPTQPRSTANTNEDAPIPANAGTRFSGKGPGLVHIQKEPGPIIAHIKTRGCYGFNLKGTGEGYYDFGPGIYQTLFKVERVVVEVKDQPVDDWVWEGRVLIDHPYYNANDEVFVESPHLILLEMHDITPECSWEIELQPLSAARTLIPGQILTGNFSEVLAVSGEIDTLQTLSTNPKVDYRHFTWIAYMDDMHAIDLDRLEPDGDLFIENLPTGIRFIEILSGRYWEILAE